MFRDEEKSRTERVQRERTGMIIRRIAMADTPTGQAVQSGDLLAEIRRIANNVIYFDDNSDYSGALWDICRKCGMADDDIGQRYIEANEKLTGGDLLASLAAIYWHSGKFSVRYWRLVPKCHLAATLKAIHDEAGRHMPDAIKQIKANKEVRGSE